MKILLSNIRSDRILSWGFLTALIFILLNLLYILFSYSKIPPLIPIFNQMPWGEARIGVKWQIFIPLFIAILIFIANLFFSSFVYKKMPLTSRMLSVTSLLICFFTLLFIIRTIQLII